MCWEAVSDRSIAQSRMRCLQKPAHIDQMKLCPVIFKHLHVWLHFTSTPYNSSMPHASSLNSFGLLCLWVVFGCWVTICTGPTAVSSHQNVTCITSAHCRFPPDRPANPPRHIAATSLSSPLLLARQEPTSEKPLLFKRPVLMFLFPA